MTSKTIDLKEYNKKLKDLLNEIQDNEPFVPIPYELSHDLELQEDEKYVWEYDENKNKMILSKRVYDK